MNKLLYILIITSLLITACHKNPNVVDIYDRVVGDYEVDVIQYDWDWNNGNFDSVFYSAELNIKKDSNSLNLLMTGDSNLLDEVLEPRTENSFGYFYGGSNSGSVEFYVNDSILAKKSKGGIGGGRRWEYKGKKK